MEGGYGRDTNKRNLQKFTLTNLQKTQLDLVQKNYFHF